MLTWEHTADGLAMLGEMDIRSAEELHQLFDKETEQAGRLNLDLSGVTRLDTTAAQLLTVLAAGGALGRMILSESVKETLAALGLLEAVQPGTN